MKRTSVFIFDTNVLISAFLLENSLPAKALDLAREKGTIVYSTETFSELSSVIKRSKFDKYASVQKRINALNTFEIRFQLVDIKLVATGSRDVKDNKFLSLALQSKASCIISGDKDLLSIGQFEKIPILTPAEFIKYLDTIQL